MLCWMKFLACDKNSKCTETLVTTGQVVHGEVKSSAYVDVQEVARGVIEKIGYTKKQSTVETKSCGVFSSIHEQSGDINRGRRADPLEQGAGDPGMMFGYATNETENYLWRWTYLIVYYYKLAKIMRAGFDALFASDAKSQVTIEYDDNGKPLRIKYDCSITQHDEFIGPKGISQKGSGVGCAKRIALGNEEDIDTSCEGSISAHVQALFNDNIIYPLNPTGKFVIGGPSQ